MAPCIVDWSLVIVVPIMIELPILQSVGRLLCVMKFSACSERLRQPEKCSVWHRRIGCLRKDLRMRRERTAWLPASIQYGSPKLNTEIRMDRPTQRSNAVRKLLDDLEEVKDTMSSKRLQSLQACVLLISDEFIP